jgi:2-iminobutanoate/2-iminopropanoate deaminase
VSIVGSTILPPTDQFLDTIATILDAAGTTMENITKATVFLTDITDFDAFNEVYARRMPEPRPARSAVEVSDLAIDVRVEIEVIAAL